MKIGTHIKLPDGKVGTVVFNGLIGHGIKWGIHYPELADFEGSSGGLFDWEPPEGFQWCPDALLRNPSDKFPGLFEKYGFQDADCVGHDFEILED